MTTNSFPRSHKHLSLAGSEQSGNIPLDGPRRSFRTFIGQHKTVLFALFSGTCCVISVVAFTAYLSRQTFQCPDWAAGCHVPRRVVWFAEHIGTVQGMSTAVYAIGLACLAYTAHVFSETALWPLLNQQHFTIKEMGNFLEASRGSIPSSPSALLSARSLHSMLVLICTIVITLVPLSAAPTVGYVYDQKNHSHAFVSEYRPGGGMGPFFVQKNPPGPRRDSASSLYTSWAWGLSQEPMPEYRDWFVDRQALLNRGNMTIGAVRMKQNISCTGWKAEAKNKKNEPPYRFHTKMAKTDRADSDHQSSEFVTVRNKPRLAVWVHDYKFLSSAKTSAKIIFAAIDGTIDGGQRTISFPDDNPLNISSIACDVDLEFVDDILMIGSGTAGVPVQINSIKNLRDPAKKKTTDKNTKNLNELALWFAVAPVANGGSVSGTQPMYQYRKDNISIPKRYMSTNEGGSNDDWTIEYIKNFIRISIGASALGESTSWKDKTADVVKVTSMAYTIKLDPSRWGLLIIPPLIIIMFGIILLVWNIVLHHRLGIPSMRLSTLDEILKSSQTEDIHGPGAIDKLDSSQPSTLRDLRVMFLRTMAGYRGLQSAPKKRNRVPRKPVREYEMLPQ